MEWEILAGLPQEQQRELLSHCVRRKYRKGETVFHESDPGNALHLLAKGRVAIRITTPMGDTATLTVMGPGAVFGEQALLNDDVVRTATAVALEPVETMTLQRAEFDELRTKHPSVERFVVSILTGQVRRLSQSLIEALYLPADKRVLRRLVDLCEVYRVPGADPAEPVSINLTQDDLASMAGTTRPTANRVLQEAVTNDFVALGRGRIEVTDPTALARRAR